MTNEASKVQDLVSKGAGVHSLIANVYAKGLESKKTPDFMQVSKFKRNAKETPYIRKCRERSRCRIWLEGASSVVQCVESL